MSENSKETPDAQDEKGLSLRRPVSRRDFLKIAGIGGAAVGLGGLVASCGSKSPSAAATTPAAAATTAAAVSSAASLAPAPTVIAGAGRGYNGSPRGFLWNQTPHTGAELAMMDTSKFKKSHPYNIGFSNASISNAWAVAGLDEIYSYYVKYKSQIKNFWHTDANDEPAKQVSDVQDLLARNPDLLIVRPASDAALDPIVTEATKKGIPVLLCDRRVTSENFLAFVNAPDMAIGRITAQWLAEKMNYQANVVMLPGAAGASPAIRRLQAAQEVFAQYPGITILDTQYTGWSPATGKTIMAAELSKYGHKINAVWSDHGLQGSGAQEAFLDAGWKDGTIPPMTGADMNIQLQFAIQHKEPVFWVDNPPIVVGKALEVAVEYVLKGIPVPHDYEINTQLVVTKGDVTPSTVYYDYLAQDFYRPQGGPNLVISVDIPNYNPSTFHNPWR